MDFHCKSAHHYGSLEDSRKWARLCDPESDPFGLIFLDPTLIHLQ